MINEIKTTKIYRYSQLIDTEESVDEVDKMIAPYMIGEKLENGFYPIFEDGYVIDAIKPGWWILKFDYDGYEMFYTEKELIEDYS